MTNVNQSNSLNTKQKAYLKRERLTTLATYISLILIMVITALVSNWIGNPIASDEAKYHYLEISCTAAFTHALNISDCLTKLNSGILTEEDLNLLLDICDKQIAADQAILDFDIDNIMKWNF